MNQLLWVCILFSVQCLKHPLCSELLIPCSGCFRYAVCVQEQGLSGSQVELIILIADSVHTAQYKTVPVMKQLVGAFLVLQSRIFMTGIRGDDMAGGQRQDAEPDCHEHIGIIVLADPFIGPLQDFMGSNAKLRDTADDDLCHHHEQGGRNPLS